MPDDKLDKPRLTEISRRLREALDPVELEVIDESHRHIGHAGASDGRGHFKIVVRAAALAGMTSLQRHRKIYAILGELMQTEIHAVTLDVAAPDHDDGVHRPGPKNNSF